jgi:hypothetical protein
MSSLTEMEIDALLLGGGSEIASAAVKLTAEAEIDTMFLEENEVCSALFLEEDSETPLTAVKQPDPFSPFNTLPAELRNMVYSQYFAEYFASNPSIKINAHGEIVKPAITYVSTEIRNETDGYYTTYLTSHKSNLSITAQISNYNLLSFPTRLVALSAQLNIPWRSLFHDMRTTCYGSPSFPNLQRYITACLEDPTPYLSHHDTITTPLSGCKGGVGPFTSEVSLDAVMRTWKRYHYACTEKHRVWRGRGNSVRWRYVAEEFLEEAKTLDLSPGRVGGGSSGDDHKDKAVAKVVFEVMANWHVILAEELAEKGVKRMMRGELDKARTRHHEMSDAVYEFQLKLRS